MIGHVHDKVKFVQGNANNKNLEWLRQSIVVKKATPINIAEVSNNLPSANKRVAKVREWGSFMVLINFKSKEAMEDVLSYEVEWLCLFFNKFRPWSSNEWPYSRKVWIECIGLQPFTWSISNLRAIGQAWGTVIGFDEDSVSSRCVGTARVLIDTYQKSHIKGWVSLDLGQMICDLYVREVCLDMSIVKVSWDVMEFKNDCIVQNSPHGGSFGGFDGVVVVVRHPTSDVAVGQELLEEQKL